MADCSRCCSAAAKLEKSGGIFSCFAQCCFVLNTALLLDLVVRGWNKLLKLKALTDKEFGGKGVEPVFLKSSLSSFRECWKVCALSLLTFRSQRRCYYRSCELSWKSKSWTRFWRRSSTVNVNSISCSGSFSGGEKPWLYNVVPLLLVGRHRDVSRSLIRNNSQAVSVTIHQPGLG